MIISRRTLLAACTMLVVPLKMAQASEPLRPFMLEDVNGATVDDGVFQGRVALVFFGYTSCGDVCPTAMMKVAEVLKRLGPDGDKLLAFFISLDPKRDTRKVLSDYAANFDPRIVPLRGPDAYLKAAANAFHVTYSVQTPDAAKPDDYEIDHTALLFLVGPDGAVASTFGRDAGADAMAARVRELLAAVKGS